MIRATSEQRHAHEWARAKLETISSFITKGSTPTTHGFKWEPSGVLFLRSECVSDHGLDLTQSMFISEEAHAFFQRSQVKPDDLLVTITGNVGRVVIFEGAARANLNQHIARVRITESSANPRFVYFWLSQASVRRYLIGITTGQAYPQISLRQVRNAEVPLPPLPEQVAIASALTDVEALLDGLDRLIAKKRDLKQAATQQLLTGQTRLPGFHREWEVKRLGELGSTFGGLTGKTKADFGQGSARYITFMNVMANVVIDCGTFEAVNVTPSESQNRAMKGDLFFNGSSETPEEVALCSVLIEDVHNVYLNSFCFGFRLRDRDETDGLFLAYYFRSKEGRELMKSLAQGSTRYNLSKVALLKSPLRLPPHPEQTAIAEALGDLDAELAVLERRREKTRALKHGMMQELLTGRTRLV